MVDWLSYHIFWMFKKKDILGLPVLYKCETYTIQYEKRRNIKLKAPISTQTEKKKVNYLLDFVYYIIYFVIIHTTHSQSLISKVFGKFHLNICQCQFYCCYVVSDLLQSSRFFIIKKNFCFNNKISSCGFSIIKIIVER